MKIGALLPVVFWITTALAKVRRAGINIAGCDFGCTIDGTCANGSYCPTGVGPSQMDHFSNKDGLNIFRIPVGWQYLVNYQLGGPLDPAYFAAYDSLVRKCLRTGARCIVDIHNYARWNGGIIGQGGPTDEQFVKLWIQLARHYRSQSRVVFGIMNEPHDLDMTTWAYTVQKVVTAIRRTGARSQWILLPGTDFTNAGSFAYNSAPYLANIRNPDGGKTGLIFDVHNYYDYDSSGTHTECVTNHIDDSYRPLAEYLRQNHRKALLSENGGGNTQSCVTNVCAALGFLNRNSDVYLGWIGWAAGSFDPATYELSEVPYGSTDTLLVQKCIAGKF